VLSALPELADLSHDEEGVRFTTEGRDANVALSALIRAGFVVLQFDEEGPRLEDVFMRETEGMIT
jgi:hypothetical protein